MLTGPVPPVPPTTKRIQQLLQRRANGNIVADEKRPRHEPSAGATAVVAPNRRGGGRAHHYLFIISVLVSAAGFLILVSSAPSSRSFESVQEAIVFPQNVDTSNQKPPPLDKSPIVTSSSSFWQKKRGLVVFYHVPKTGGTIVREVLERHGVPVKRVFSTKQLTGYKYGERIRRLLNGETMSSQKDQNGNEDDGELLVLELHGRFVGLPDMPIRQWRQSALQHGVPFFAFTLLRDPVAFHDSYFSFFHRPGCLHRWCEPIIYDDMSEENLLESLAPNKQCEILYHGQLELKWNATQVERRVTETECSTVLDVLRTDWDWVGTTETVATVTIPMLFRLLQNNVVAPTVPKFTSRLKVVETEQTKATIRRRSWLDERLYALYNDSSSPPQQLD